MATSYKNFQRGFGVIPKASSESTLLGEFEVLTDGKFYFHNGTTSSSVITATQPDQGAGRLKNKDLEANTVKFVDGTDPTIAFKINLVGGTTATSTTFSFTQTANRTISFPDRTDTVVTLAGTETLTNKTLTLPKIAQISNTGTLTLPTSTDTLVGRATTDTLTNKTLSSPIINSASADTISGIVGQLLLNATLVGINNFRFSTNTMSDSSGGVIIQSNNATNGVTLNGIGSGFVSLQKDTTQVAFVNTGAINLVNQSALRLQSSTTNYVGFAAPSSVPASYTVTMPSAAPGASTALVYNGTNYVWSQAGGWSVATQASVVGTITLGAGGQQTILVAGSGPVTLSTTPFGSTPPNDGTVIRLICTSSSNTVSLTNNDIANGAILNGNVTLYRFNMIEFQYMSSLARYVETGRNF